MYTSFVNILRCEAEFHNPLKSFAYYHKPTFGGGQSFNVFAPEDRLIPTVLLQFRSICGAPLGVRLLRWPPNCHADDNNHYSDCRLTVSSHYNNEHARGQRREQSTFVDPI